MDPGTLALLSTIATVGSTVMGGIAANQAEKAEARRAEFEAEELKIDRDVRRAQAVQDANEIRERHLRAFATNINNAGYDPFSSSSFEALTLANKRSTERDLFTIDRSAGIDDSRFLINIEQKHIEAAESRKQGKIKLFSSLISGAAQGYTGYQDWKKVRRPGKPSGGHPDGVGP